MTDTIITRSKESKQYFDSLPKPEQDLLIRNQQYYLTRLQERAAPGVTKKDLIGTTDSMYRAPSVNAKEGGSSTSRHLKGQAADYDADKFPDLKGGIRTKMAKDGDMAWYHFKSPVDGSDQIHIEYRGKTPASFVYPPPAPQDPAAPVLPPASQPVPTAAPAPAADPTKTTTISNQPAAPTTPVATAPTTSPTPTPAAAPAPAASVGPAGSIKKPTPAGLDGLVADLDAKVGLVLDARMKMLDSHLEDMSRLPVGFLKLSANIREALAGRLYQEMTGTKDPDRAQELLENSGVFGNTKAVIEEAIEIFMDMTGSGTAKFNPEDVSEGTGSAKIDHGAATKDSTGDSKTLASPPTNVPGSGNDVLSAFARGFAPTTASIPGFGGSPQDIQDRTRYTSQTATKTQNQVQTEMVKDPDLPWQTFQDQAKSAVATDPNTAAGLMAPAVETLKAENVKRQSFIDEVDGVLARAQKIAPYLPLLGKTGAKLNESIAQVSGGLQNARTAIFMAESAAQAVKSVDLKNFNALQVVSAQQALNGVIKVFTNQEDALGTRAEAESIAFKIQALQQAPATFDAITKKVADSFSSFGQQVASVENPIAKSQGSKYKRARAAIEGVQAKLAMSYGDGSKMMPGMEGMLTTLRATAAVLDLVAKDNEQPMSGRIAPDVTAGMAKVATVLQGAGRGSAAATVTKLKDVWEGIRRAKEATGATMGPTAASAMQQDFSKVIQGAKATLDPIRKDAAAVTVAARQWSKAVAPLVQPTADSMLNEISKIGFSGAMEMLGLGDIASFFGATALSATLEGSVMKAIGDLVGALSPDASAKTFTNTKLSPAQVASELAAATPLQKTQNPLLTPAQETILAKLQHVVLQDIRRVSIEFSRRIISLPDRDRRTNDLIQATQINPLIAMRAELKRAFAVGK